MDKGINKRGLLLLEEAKKVLDYMGIEYDKSKLKIDFKACREIVLLYKNKI